MSNFIAQVNTENQNDGCFIASFANLDEVRVFIKESAAKFRKMDGEQTKCVATICRNGAQSQGFKHFKKIISC